LLRFYSFSLSYKAHIATATETQIQKRRLLLRSLPWDPAFLRMKSKHGLSQWVSDAGGPSTVADVDRRRSAVQTSDYCDSSKRSTSVRPSVSPSVVCRVDLNNWLNIGAPQAWWSRPVGRIFNRRSSSSSNGYLMWSIRVRLTSAAAVIAQPTSRLPQSFWPLDLTDPLPVPHGVARALVFSSLTLLLRRRASTFILEWRKWLTRRQF